MRTCGRPDRILSTEEAAGRPVIDDRRIAWRVGAHLHIFDHRTGRHRIIRAPGGQPLLAAHRVFFRFGGRLMRLLP